LSEERSIPPTLEADEMMWAAGAYIFWPVMWLALLLSPKKTVPFVRYHTLQGFLFGLAATFFFLLLSVIIFVMFRSAGTQSMTMGIVFVALFGIWLCVLFALFLMFLFYAYRAGQGQIFRLPILSHAAQPWALSALDEEL